MSLWQLDRASWRLRRFLDEYKPTAIMGEWLNFASSWFGSIRGMGFRFFAHAHGYDVTQRALRQPKSRILYRHLARMDGVITMSEITKRRLVDELKLRPDRIHVIPYGVEVPAISMARDETETIICLCVGRMVEKKGPLQTLRAFEAAYRNCPRLRLEYVGAGPLLDQCQAYAREHNLCSVVTFHGSQSHVFVKQRLAQANIFLLHSMIAPNGDEEGLPVAILEAMAYGLPIVSTLHAGIPEAVLDGNTGFLVAEKDEAAMSRRIGDLATNASLCREMGSAGRKRATKLYSHDSEISALQRLLFQ